MRSFLFWVTSYILIGVTLLQNVNSLDNSDQPNLFSSNDGDDTSSSDPIMIPDLGTDDLWSSSDLTNFIDADNTEPMFDDHNDDFSIASCSPSSNSDTLNRRRGGAGETCTNPQKLNEDAQEQNPPADVKFRLTGTTKDQPILIPTYNLEICDALIMGTFRTIVACDSGRKEDRKPTTDMGVFILEHCTPFDILKGCRFPHDIWCCTDLTPEIDADELRDLHLNIGAQFNLLMNQFELIPGYWAGGCKRLDPTLPNWDVDSPRLV